jgi:hypothetical protein
MHHCVAAVALECPAACTAGTCSADRVHVRLHPACCHCCCGERCSGMIRNGWDCASRSPAPHFFLDKRLFIIQSLARPFHSIQYKVLDMNISALRLQQRLQCTFLTNTLTQGTDISLHLAITAITTKHNPTALTNSISQPASSSWSASPWHLLQNSPSLIRLSNFVPLPKFQPFSILSGSLIILSRDEGQLIITPIIFSLIIGFHSKISF